MLHVAPDALPNLTSEVISTLGFSRRRRATVTVSTMPAADARRLSAASRCWPARQVAAPPPFVGVGAPGRNVAWLNNRSHEQAEGDHASHRPRIGLARENASRTVVSCGTHRGGLGPT